MAEDDVLAKALADVRQRRADLQADYDRVTGELTKLQAAERSLASIVEGASLPAAGNRPSTRVEAYHSASTPPATSRRRGPRGPRARSGKGRLRALLDEAGQDGVTQDLIAKRLADVSTPTLNAYLSTMVSSGDVIRDGDLFRAVAPRDNPDHAGEEDDAPEADEVGENANS